MAKVEDAQLTYAIIAVAQELNAQTFVLLLVFRPLRVIQREREFVSLGWADFSEIPKRRGERGKRAALTCVRRSNLANRSLSSWTSSCGGHLEASEVNP